MNCASGYFQVGNASKMSLLFDLSAERFKKQLHAIINRKWAERVYKANGVLIGYRLVSYQELFKRFQFQNTYFRRSVNCRLVPFFKLSFNLFDQFQKGLLAQCLQTKRDQFLFQVKKGNVRIKNSTDSQYQKMKDVYKNGFEIQIRTIAQTLGFSPAKVSRLVRDMETDEEVNWFRVKRENAFIADAAYDEYLKMIKTRTDRDRFYYDHESSKIFKRKCNRYIFSNDLDSICVSEVATAIAPIEYSKSNEDIKSVGATDSCCCVNLDEGGTADFSLKQAQIAMTSAPVEVIEQLERLKKKFAFYAYELERDRIKVFKEKNRSQRFAFNELNMIEFYLSLD
jgi:hypothetical protein